MNRLNVSRRCGRHLLLASLSLAAALGVVVSLCVRHAAVLAEEPQAVEQSKTKSAEAQKALQAQRVEMLRKKFPYVSLKPRLEYESRRAAAAEPPKLGPQATERLEEREFIALRFPVLREQSLALLHSDEVKRFAARDGFGKGRMLLPSPSIDYIETQPPKPIPFAATSTSGGDEGSAAVPLPDEWIVSIDEPAWLPSSKLLNGFHMRGQLNFVNSENLGQVINRDQVAGFLPHAFSHSPELLHPQTSQKQATNRWLIRRLELVSLLKHAVPVAYLSERMPRMEDLKAAKTRPLQAFERQSLKKLYDGEELVAEATLNHVRMVGAVRATRQCMECHEVRRGELLGAFSYDLVRTPPVPVQKVPPKPAT